MQQLCQVLQWKWTAVHTSQVGCDSRKRHFIIVQRHVCTFLLLCVRNILLYWVMACAFVPVAASSVKYRLPCFIFLQSFMLIFSNCFFFGTFSFCLLLSHPLSQTFSSFTCLQTFFFSFCTYLFMVLSLHTGKWYNKLFIIFYSFPFLFILFYLMCFIWGSLMWLFVISEVLSLLPF